MTTTEHGDEKLLDHILQAYDDRAELLAQVPQLRGERINNFGFVGMGGQHLLHLGIG